MPDLSNCRTLQYLVLICLMLVIVAIPRTAEAQTVELPPPTNDTILLPFIMTGPASSSLPDNTPNQKQVVRVYFDGEDDIAYLKENYDVWEEAIGEQEYVTVYVSNAALDSIIAQGYETEIDLSQTTSLNGPVPLFGHGQLDEDNLLNRNINAIPGFACYRTVEETHSSLAQLAAANPTLATWIDVGDSYDKMTDGGPDGYDMYVLKLTNSAIPGPKPDLMIISAIHAREYTTAELNTRFAEYLVSNYGVNPDVTWLLDYNEIHIMAQANPDGRKIAEGGQLWRKNRNPSYGCVAGDYGIDLNRNSSFQWGGTGSSSNTCSQTYRGPDPASEVEVQSIQNYAESIFTDQRGPGLNDAAPADTEGVFITIHSYSELVLYPWGWTNNPAPNNDEMATLGRKFGYFNGYEVCNDCLYIADGVTDDYTYGTFGVPSYTFELGTSFFQDCATFENTIYPDNLPALVYAAKAARLPYQIPAGPDAVNVTFAEPIVEAGTPAILTATIDDTRSNSNGQGVEPTQTIQAARYSIGSPSWDGGTTTLMSAADGTFNNTVEAVTASIDTSGLSNGTYTLFVEGQDANGDWGATTAVNLEIGTPPTVLFFDNFESGSNWTTNPNGSDTATTGQWEVGDPQDTNSSGPKQLGTTFSGNNDLVTARLAGTSVGTNDIDNGETSVRSPDIVIPASGDTTLSFAYYMAHTDNSSADDYLRVKVVGSSTQTVLEELGAPNDDDGAWESFSISLNDFAGQTIYLLVEAADASGGSIVEAALDDVRISSTGDTPTPVPTSTPISGTNTPTPTPISTDTPTPVDTPTPTNTPISTDTPTPTPTPTPDGIGTFYVSSSTGGTVGSISFADEDILSKSANTWSRLFDMSDLGTTMEINAFALLEDGSAIVSYAGATTVGNLSVDDSDLVRFVPSASSTGNNTSGSVELYFDGSTAGLTTNGEDIDAVMVLANGDLIISTIGNYSVGNLSGNDEDLLRYSNEEWSRYFDGSDVGLSSSSEDIYGVWVDESSGNIYFTTRGTTSALNAVGDGADIYVCDPASLGDNTSCNSLTLYWDGSAEGYAGEIMDALFIGE